MYETVGGRLRTTLVAAVAVLGCVLFAATSARAGDFKILSFDNSALTASGDTDTRAGAHPYKQSVDMEFPVKTVSDQSGPVLAPVENLKETTVDLPVGFAGDPTSVPKCAQSQLDLGTCPPDTQIGTVQTRSVPNLPTITAPLYNLVPPPGEPAQFGFTPALFPIRIGIKVRTGSDYGITATVHDIAEPVAITGTNVTLWGVPADPRHDAERSQLCEFFPSFNITFCIPLNGGPGPVRQVPKPFLTNPSNCDAGPLPTTARVSSWQHPDDFSSATSVSHLQGGGGNAGVDSCDKLVFKPTVTAKPDNPVAGAPGGWAIDLDVPQNDNPTGLATPPLKKVAVTFPAGVTISASSADGLAACSPAQVALTSEGDANCPDASKVGSVTVDTPVLDDPLEGSVYLAKQNDNPFNSLIALYIVAKGSGVIVKLPGKIDLDPKTGQVVGTFDNNPQLPFSHLRMELKSGTRAALSNPKTCGTYTTHAELTSWASHTPVSSDSSFTINQGCDKASKFTPTMDAGLTNPTAGTSSSFVLNFGRPDGQQDLGALGVQLPPGLLANVGSVPLCPEAQAAAGTCPATSQVGVTSVEAGPGTAPLGIPQAGKAPTGVYLAGPYKGAPYSLSIVVPAQAGPFDLGTVVVRSALAIDPVDAHATVTSDPLPTMLQGIPLNIQKVHVAINRPGFMVTPTSCDPMAINGAVFSAQGAVGQVSSRFQVGGCSALGFEPKLAMSLSGKGQTKDGGHPALSATLDMPSKQANIKKVQVTLPLALALDPDNAQSNDLCEFAAGQKTIPECPKSSIVGTATATTPLLNVPLTGPVYFVKNIRIDPKTKRQIRTLPTLAIPLQGSGITLVVRASSQVVDEHLVATFDKIPDAPVSNFKLNIFGGKKDILVVSDANICSASQVAKQVATGHNNKVQTKNITLSTPSCPLGVARSSHTSSSLKLTVGGLGAGKVTVSGKGLAKTSRTLASASVATLQPKFTKSVKSQLAHGHNVKIRVTISFTPKGAKKAKTAHKTLTVHGA